MPKTTDLRAMRRLDEAGALPTLLRGGLPPSTLQRLLADALPEQARDEMPVEIWSSLAAGISAENESFARVIAAALNDHLAWDHEPGTLDELWPIVRERPLEALWIAARSEERTIRDEFDHVTQHCLENFQESAGDAPPSWEFIRGVLGVQARTVAQLRETERRADDAQRRCESMKRQLTELREALKRLRRQNNDLSTARAAAERRAAHDEAPTESASARRMNQLEAQVRKLEKARAHALREQEGEHAPKPVSPGREDAPKPTPTPEGLAFPSIEDDPDPQRRLLRFVLSKLIAKGKIGGAHTHVDHVYRGIADHEKGLAKQLVERLYKEGYLIPKPTGNDPHLSLSPAHLGRAREIIEGRITDPRLASLVESEHQRTAS